MCFNTAKAWSEASPQASRFTLDLRSAPLKELLDYVEEKSDYTFLFDNTKVDVRKKISVSVKNVSIGPLLTRALDSTGIAYKMVSDTQIMLLPDAATRNSLPLEEKPVQGAGWQRRVTGQVSGEDGMSLPGISVVVKGSGQGVATDLDGKYEIPAGEGDTLVFSGIGFATLEEPVNGRAQIDVQLQEDAQALGEVVVVGYGTQRRANVIGSVSQVSAQNLENRPVSQLAQALTGQMPGVTVIQRSGRPGDSGGTIRVRGVGSFGATPDALVLIDGIPGGMNELNPDDVQSVSVLKDASSAAIYGARSANGVILVTTKTGEPGKTQITYNGYVGMNKPTELPDFVNSWEYAEMYNIASGSNSYTSEDIAMYASQSDPDNYPNTHFLKELLSRNGVQTGHALSISGGGEKNTYFLSAGMLDQQGVIERNSYRRYNLRLNMETSLARQLSLTTRLSGSFGERKEPLTSGNRAAGEDNLINQLIQNAVRYPAVFLGQASNGDFGVGAEGGGTPISWLASDSYLRNPRSRAAINVKLDWRPLNGLTLSALGGYHIGFLEMRRYQGAQRLNSEVFLPQSSLNQSNDKQTYRTAQFLAEYNRSLQEHRLGFLLGYAFENQVGNLLNAYRQDFPSNDYTVLDMGGAANQQSGGSDNEWAIQSVFGRFKYDYREKYLLEATLRYDGSSRFPEDNKYALFPSAAIGWRLSEEDFLKPLSWISDLKLKASWGILGNQNIGDYPYQAVLNSGQDYPFGGSVSTGAAYTTYRDADIRWESTQTTDIGLESGFFEGRLRFNATYFVRNTSDILFNPSSSVSTVLGVEMSETNTGEARNAGWEFELGYRGGSGDFSYSAAGNFSIIRNEVLTLGLGNVQQPNGFVGNGSDLFIGYPMQLYYGYLSDGVFLDETDIAAWADQSAVTPNPQAGDIRYKDINGPDGVPDGKVDPTYDRTYLGSEIPKYTFGLNLGFRYKAFDFKALLQGVAGVTGQLNNYAGWAFFNLGNIQRWQMEGRFDPENPVRYPEYPRLEVITNSGTPNTQTSDFWAIDASYVRVKNLQLGYTFPEPALNKIGISRIRMYFSAENLFSFNSYREGWDPEINTQGSYYPVLATYTLGINVKF